MRTFIRCLAVHVYMQAICCGISTGSNSTITVYVGTTTIVTCNIQYYNYPGWAGPGGLVYNYLGTATFNPILGDHISWYSNKRDITIRNVTKADAGVYQCTSTGTSYTRTVVVKDCLLKFNTGATTEIFTFVTSVSQTPGMYLETYKIVNEKYSILLAKFLNGSLFGNVSMLDDVILIGDVTKGNFSFQLTNVSATKAGTYTFEKGIEEISCVRLYILGRPTSPRLSKGHDTEIGDSANFTCTGATSTTKPSDLYVGMTYDWYINSHKNPSGDKYTYVIDTLAINFVSKNDNNRTVLCSATENLIGGMTSENSNLEYIKVVYGPDNIGFDPFKTSYYIREGVRLADINCHAECNPECLYSWTKDQMISDVQYLSLGTIERKENGTYSCTARRGSYTLKQVLTIYVVYLASIIEMYADNSPNKSTLIVNQDDSLQISCDVDSFPVATINIVHEGKILIQTNATNQISYWIKHMSCSGAGIYICSAWNQYFPTNISSEKLVVNVNCPVRAINNDEVEKFAPLVQPYVLQLAVDGHPEPTKYTWYKKNSNVWNELNSNSKLIIASNGSYSNLTIVDVGYNDFGKYGVKADNGLGGPLLTKKFNLYQEGIPEEPELYGCQLSPTTSSSVRVIFKSGHNGGFSQTFVIQCRRPGQSVLKQYFQVQNETNHLETMFADLDELEIDSVYHIQIYSKNVKGNSSLSDTCTVSIPGEVTTNVEGNTAAAAGGGIAGGFVFGTLVSLCSLLGYKYLKRNSREDKIPVTPMRKQEVYFNVAEEIVEGPYSEAKDKAERQCNEYEELKQSLREQPYDHLEQQNISS